MLQTETPLAGKVRPSGKDMGYYDRTKSTVIVSGVNMCRRGATHDRSAAIQSRDRGVITIDVFAVGSSSMLPIWCVLLCSAEVSSRARGGEGAAGAKTFRTRALPASVSCLAAKKHETRSQRTQYRRRAGLRFDHRHILCTIFLYLGYLSCSAVSLPFFVRLFIGSRFFSIYWPPLV